jgi:flagellar biosynthesis protein FlhG
MMDQAEKLRLAIDKLKKIQSMGQEDLPVPPKKRLARVITVTSGKGGVGKSNITINLAIALSEQGFRIVILDADFGLANIDVLFGIAPRYTMLDMIKNQKSILEILADGPKNTKFISGGSGVEDLVKLERQQIMSFIENMSLLDKIADIIIVDTSAGLSENVMSFVTAADDVILVTSPEPTSITDAYALIKMLSNIERHKKVRLVVNRAESSKEANDVLNKLVLVAEKFLGMTLEPAGFILNDDAVIKAVKQQKPFILSFPKSHAAKSIMDISVKLANRDVVEGETAQNQGIRVFFSKLVEYLKA